MASPAGTPRELGGDLRAPPPDASGRLWILYGRLLGPLLAGYLLLDRAFAYLHLPGSPLFVGEMVLGVGAAAAVVATHYLKVPIRDESILAPLIAFAAWGLIRTVPGVATYHLDAVRDAALWFYCLFAFFVIAALARSPELLDRWINGLSRLAPWLLLWLPFAVVLYPLADSAPTVPFSTVSVLSHKAGSSAIAALLVLGCMWLLPGTRSARSRTGWSLMALVVVALAATQNRGGLLGVMAGGAVGLAFLRNRVGLAARVVLVMTVGLGLASLLSLKVPLGGLQGREFSATQLISNVASLGGKETPGNLGGTVEGRQQLWSRILDKQVADGHLVDGSGFGQNLASEVGILDAGKDSLRSPHNSHLHIMARLGLVGISLWIALWVGWYWRMIGGCRRLAREGLHTRRQVGVLSLMVTTAVLVSCFFDPQLEGPQVAALLWTSFGIGVAVTTVRPWFRGGMGP
ncbi:O-antigen ligase family protein [Kribbella sp. NPDC050241]|uniref:O-antigen ligase family protein n=1 Tax=Kribbella sp. NPDC050241 TaxID=3364115 RepID=UPI0037B0B550